MNKNNVILHVEDDPNDVVLVELAFRKASAGCVLKVVNDGEQACSYLNGDGQYSNRSEFPFPALMLLDIKLPKRSGLEVLEWVRSQAEPQLKYLPIVILTSSNQQADITRAYDLGVNSFLVKPGDLGLLGDMAKAVSHYWLSFNVKPATAKSQMADQRASTPAS